MITSITHGRDLVPCFVHATYSIPSETRRDNVSTGTRTHGYRSGYTFIQAYLRVVVRATRTVWEPAP